MKNQPNIIFFQQAKLPTKYGQFNMVSFKEKGSSKEHLVLTMGDIRHKENVLTRVHSECLTGDVFSSLKCDCGQQLETSLEMIAKKKEGMIVYLKQEGRGIGLFNKVNAYALQDSGLNTIEANHSLGFETDLRSFDHVSVVIDFFEVQSINLLTNNPVKIAALTSSTIKSSNAKSLIIQPNPFNKDYLNIKKTNLNHAL